MVRQLFSLKTEVDEQEEYEQKTGHAKEIRSIGRTNDGTKTNTFHCL